MTWLTQTRSQWCKNDSEGLQSVPLLHSRSGRRSRRLIEILQESSVVQYINKTIFSSRPATPSTIHPYRTDGSGDPAGPRSRPSGTRTSSGQHCRLRSLQFHVARDGESERSFLRTAWCLLFLLFLRSPTSEWSWSHPSWHMWWTLAEKILDALGNTAAFEVLMSMSRELATGVCVLEVQKTGNFPQLLSTTLSSTSQWCYNTKDQPSRRYTESVS